MRREELGTITDAAKRLSPFEKMVVIREAGNGIEEKLRPNDLNTERGFAMHLAAHSVLEELLTGTVSQDLNIYAPCPYCGKLPPDEP